MNTIQISIKSAFSIVIIICISKLYAGNIDFQIIASGTNAGFSPYKNNYIINNEIEFHELCDSINLNPNVLSYNPNFDSIQIIGIVYGQSTLQARHFIRSIHNYSDTTRIEITYSIPSIPKGLIPRPGYKYQIVAIPKQTEPIAFKLVQATNVNYYRSRTYSRLSNVNGGFRHTYDLLGRQILNANIRTSFSIRFEFSESNTFRITPFINHKNN